MFFSFEPHEKFEDLCDKFRAQWKEREREGGKEGEGGRESEREIDRETERDRDRLRDRQRDRDREIELQNVTAFQKEIKDSKMS